MDDIKLRESKLDELKNNIKSKIQSIDEQYHPIDLNTKDTSEDKLKHLNESVSLIDKMVNNFHNATQEDETVHKSLMNKLNDVISGKMEPTDLEKQMKGDDDKLDVDEMLSKGHINAKKTEEMKS